MVAASSGLTASLTEASPAETRDSAAGELGRVLARLPADARTDSVERCAELARTHESIQGKEERDRIIKAIRLVVQHEQDRAHLIEKNRKKLEDLYRDLDGLVGRPVETLRGMLKGLDLEAPLPDDLEGRVTTTRDAARAEQDRAFVLEAASAALQDLGYSVGEQFRTAVVDEGALLELPHSGQHALRIRERNHQLMFNVVRYDETGARDPVADTRAEESFCSDFDAIRERLRSLGIDLTMLRADPPGSHPVQVMKEAPRQQSSQSRARPALRSRER
jgi:hypothetical protein